MKRRNTFKEMMLVLILLAIIVASGITLTKQKNFKYLSQKLTQDNLLSFKKSEDKSQEVGDNKKILSNENSTFNNETNQVEDRVEKVKISAIGDFLIHQGIINSQYVQEEDSYDFLYNFQHIENYVNNADLTIANLETTFAGPDIPYSGYPTFNCPDQLSKTMKKIGIDIVCNMSNHTLDEGEAGFYRTRQVLNDSGLDIIGSRNKASDKRYILKEVNGVKLGIIGYSYVTEDPDGTLGLNCIPISNQVRPLMNIFNPNNLQPYLEEMNEQIRLMREDKADAIVFYMHWGEEYQLEPNESQLQIAQYLADQGVNIIFGDHPHTIQPIDMLTSADGKSKTAVIYSLGNFISCQRTETIDNPYTEDGIIVDVTITKDFKSGNVSVDMPTYIPTWVKADSIEGETKYTVVPGTDLNADYLEGWQRQRILESSNRTSSIVESYNQAVTVGNN